MLGESDFAGRDSVLAQQHLDASELLCTEQVAAYEFMEHGAEAMNISGEHGIEAKLFDKCISALNRRTEQIYFAKEDAQDVAGEV